MWRSIVWSMKIRDFIREWNAFRFIHSCWQWITPKLICSVWVARDKNYRWVKIVKNINFEGAALLKGNSSPLEMLSYYKRSPPKILDRNIYFVKSPTKYTNISNARRMEMHFPTLFKHPFWEFVYIFHYSHAYTQVLFLNSRLCVREKCSHKKNDECKQRKNAKYCALHCCFSLHSAACLL